MTARRVALLVTLAVAALSFCPAPVWSLCPNCLGQRSALTPTLELVGLFLLVPFASVLVVYRLLRRALGGGRRRS